jgi:D-sedoheptulose 7-phosphate isomerase
MLDSILLKKQVIQESLARTKSVIDNIIADQVIQKDILKAVELVYQCLQNGGKLLFAGNGGSAADAQHMSAEYVSKFMFDRSGLASVALTTDTVRLNNSYSK